MRHVVPLVLLAMSVTACGSSEVHPETAKLAATQPQCDFVNYHHDESVNVQGSGKCTTDCDCDGVRSCTGGECTGTARPTDTAHCNSPEYKWNEAWNGGGDGVCATDCECNGTRTCVSGHCQGNPPAKPGDSAFTR
jgi:hypothetical protein